MVSWSRIEIRGGGTVAAWHAIHARKKRTSGALSSAYNSLRAVGNNADFSETKVLSKSLVEDSMFYLVLLRYRCK